MSAEKSPGVDDLAQAYLTQGALPALPDRHFIGGDWIAGGAPLTLHDPALAAPFHEVAGGGAAEVAQAVAAAKAAQRGWSLLRASERGAILMRAAALLREEAACFAFVESLDSGKPLQEAEGDVSGAARAFDYYAGAADKIEGRSFPIGAEYLGYSEPEPVGITAHIIPWNYPISTAARGIAPALAAGCTVVAKPAETTPLTMLMLAELLVRAGLPAGVCNVVAGLGETAGAALVAHRDVRHVTFTGSVPTGQGVMRSAAGSVASVVLELGGKSPVIVLADADLDAAAEGITGAIFENAGQICSAGARLVVSQEVHAELIEKVLSRAEALNPGHGLRRPSLGPLNSAGHLARVAGRVEAAQARGATPLLGGAPTTDPVTGKGWFFEPTIFDALPETDPLVQEEIFGPVLAVQIARDADHALSLAYCSDVAVAAEIYTRDFAAAHRMAREVDAGQVFINEYFAGGIEVPFGGNRRSGFGREKGFDAVRNYQRVKAVAARIT